MRSLSAALPIAVASPLPPWRFDSRKSVSGMTDRARQHSMADLHAQTGFNPRTIRYYISQGLIPAAHGRGPGATYDEGHLARLQLIQLLKAQHLPLDDIRVRLNELSDRQVRAMVSTDAQAIGDRWRRVALHPDIELHVRDQETPKSAALDEAIALILDLVKPVIDRLKPSR